MIFALICGAVLQALIPNWRVMGQAHVPLLLGLVLYYALSPDRGLMWTAAVLAGFLQDALGEIPLGYSSFCFCLVALVVSRFREDVFAHEILMHAVAGALAAGAVTLALTVLLTHDQAVVLSAGRIALKLVGSVLLGAAVTPVVFHALEGTDRMLGNLYEEAA
jgi:rod shape-determining protein MreD